MTDESFSIGPGAICEASTEGGPRFILSASEWITLQSYIIDAMALPTDMDAFRMTLGQGAPSDLSDFNQLVSAYKNIHDHADTWQNDTFPDSVSLASDIFNYSLKAPTYYDPLLPLAKELRIDPDDEDARDELMAILASLSKSATKYHDRAAAVAEKIKQFANDTQADKVTLCGTDGKSGLYAYYEDKYGSESEEIQNLTKQIESERIVLDAANKEYDHDVVVAATTPTYVWVVPFGTIAASVVAGVYGKRATDALKRARDAQNQINELSAELASSANMLVSINMAEAGIRNILEPLEQALPIIQKIQGVWGSIRDDLNQIITTITDDIGEAEPIIMKLGVKTAVAEWKAVGELADAYRMNAYVTVNQEEPASMGV